MSAADPFYKLYKDAGIVPIEVFTNGIVASICFVGIVLNSALVYATIKTKSLRSTCQILIAIYAFLSSFHIIGYSTKFFVFLFGINYVTLQTCFCMQFVPITAASLVTSLQMCIGIDRLTGVSCPIWYKAGGKFITFKLIICFCIVLSVIKISYYYYGSSKHWEMPMMCAMGDPVFLSETATISNTWSLVVYGTEFLCYALIGLISWWRKAKDQQSTSDNVAPGETDDAQRLLISLTVLMTIGLFCYIGNMIFFHMIMPSLQLNIFTIEYVVVPICYAFGVAANGSTTPVLFLCTKDYRRAIRSIFMPAWRHRQAQVHIIRNNLPDINQRRQNLIQN